MAPAVGPDSLDDSEAGRPDGLSPLQPGDECALGHAKVLADPPAVELADRDRPVDGLRAGPGQPGALGHGEDVRRLGKRHRSGVSRGRPFRSTPSATAARQTHPPPTVGNRPSHLLALPHIGQAATAAGFSRPRDSSGGVGSERSYPSAAACLAEDLPALCVTSRYPLRLRKRLRSTNLLERSLEEVKRRTKVIGRFPGETSCLSLCWAVLDLFIASARGLAPTALEHRQLAQMRAGRIAQTPDSLSA